MPSAAGNKIIFSGYEHEIHESGLTGFFAPKSADAKSITLSADKAYNIKINPEDVQNFWATLNENITIQYNAGTGGKVNRASETLASITGEAQGSTATANTGYSFVNWIKDGTEEITENPITPARTDDGIYVAATYTANFQANTYTVTFDANSGVTPSPASQTVTYDSTYGELPTTSRAGYNFKGWFTERSRGTEATSTTKVSIADYHILYAQWEPISYYITYNLNGGTNYAGAPLATQWKIQLIFKNQPGEDIPSQAGIMPKPEAIKLKKYLKVLQGMSFFMPDGRLLIIK